MKTKLSVLLALSLALSISSHAATIVYTGPSVVPDDVSGSGVLNTGTYVVGMNVGNVTGVTVNSVSFTGGGISGANQTLSNSGVTLTVQTVTGGGFGTLGGATYTTNTQVAGLFSAGAFTAINTGTITATLSGLTIGQEYRLSSYHFQSNSNPDSREMKWQNASNTSNESAFFTYENSTTNIAELGVRMDLIWTADATSQSFVLLPDTTTDRAILDGIAVHAIPEPSSALLLMGAFAGLLALRRRR